MGSDVLLDRGLVDLESRGQIIKQDTSGVAGHQVSDLLFVELTADALQGSSFGPF